MATVSTTLAAGSTASPYYYEVRITKQLCRKTPNAPVFTPIFSVVGYKQTSIEGVYEATVNVQGIASYTPCGCCCTKSQTVNENFVIPFVSTTAVPSSVTVASGTATNSLVTGSGCTTCCSNTFLSDVPISLTIITA